MEPPGRRRPEDSAAAERVQLPPEDVAVAEAVERSQHVPVAEAVQGPQDVPVAEAVELPEDVAPAERVQGAGVLIVWKVRREREIEWLFNFGKIKARAGN